MFDNSDGFPFVVGGAMATVTNVHPPAIQMFQLWQIYINNVNPLLKVTHTPTLQAQVISASANPAKISKPLEALMFAIYFAAITSLTEEEVHSTFGEDKAILLGKYHNATQQALVNAGFMRATELMVLQAFFLYLVTLSSRMLIRPVPSTDTWSQLCARPYVDPRSMFCLLGMAFRIAARLGLHRDGSQTDMSPFEAEQRRRLWWQIVVFDKRIAEITGSTVTALSSCAGDTRMPLNINDSDLNVHAKGQPGAYAGPTEMVFSLTRIELTVAASPDNVRRTVTTPGGRPLHKPMVHYSPTAASPDVVSHVASQSLPSDLAAFCAYVENVYLKQCDPKVPLHYFTLLMTRQALCKLRIIDFLCRTASTDNVEQSERDNYFMEALRMVEYDNLIQSSDMLQGFRWYTYAHFPLPAYLCLVSELRHRTTGELCERAWNVMIENHDLRGMLRRHNRNPLHIAFGRYFVKAWDAREAAELHLGRSLATPKIVALLRNTLAKTRQPGPPRPPALTGPMMGPPSGHQVGVQPVMPPQGFRAATGMPTAGDMNAPSAGMSAGMYSSKPITPQGSMPPQSSMPPQMGGIGAGNPMMIDDATMYSGYDNIGSNIGNSNIGNSNIGNSNIGNSNMGNNNMGNNIYNGGPSAPMQDAEFGGMDWNYLVQLSSLSGFSPTGGYYVQGTGA